MLLVTFKYIVFALLIIVCAMLLLLVLMQRPKQEGLGAAFGAQMTDQAFGARTTDVLKKGTIFFGSLFMILCFVLSVLILKQDKVKNGEGLPVAAAAQPVVQQPVQTETQSTETPAETPTEAPAESAPVDAPAEGSPVETSVEAPAAA